jgi:hypothetical protein
MSSYLFFKKEDCYLSRIHSVIKERIFVYFFVNEEVAQSLEVTKESVWATAFRGLKPD